MLALILSSFFLFDSLTEENAQKMGLSKLSLEEKKALQDWVENNYERKSKKRSQKSKGPILEAVMDAGKYVRLSDGSLWEIAQKDTPVTQSWITPTEIKALFSEEKPFDHTLTNTLSGSWVRAKKAENDPSKSAQK